MPDPERFQTEETFHDQWAKSMQGEELNYREFFEAATAPENRYILSVIGPLKRAKILDLGTGPGEATVYFREKGAHVISFDLSQEMLKYARLQSTRRGLGFSGAAGNATALPFRDGAFDIVYGANILHHVPYREVIPEVARVLKPGGRTFFTEPLAYNPAINVYRYLSRNVHTPDEKAFHFPDLKIFETCFGQVVYKEFWFFTLWLFVQFFLIERASPAKERYWKKILSEAKRLEKEYYFLEKMDKMILKICPFLRYWCWNVVVTATK